MPASPSPRALRVERTELGRFTAVNERGGRIPFARLPVLSGHRQQAVVNQAYLLEEAQGIACYPAPQIVPFDRGKALQRDVAGQAAFGRNAGRR